MPRRSLYLGLVLLAGCVMNPKSIKNLPTSQFSDLPVPHSLELKTKMNESFGYERGFFRVGHFEYKGTAPLSEIESFVSKRLPVHGWVLDAHEKPGGGPIRLVFKRTAETRVKYLLRAELRMQGPNSLLTYDLRTDR